MIEDYALIPPALVRIVEGLAGVHWRGPAGPAGPAPAAPALGGTAP